VIKNHVKSCKNHRNEDREKYNESRAQLDAKFRLYKLSLAVRWAYNQIRIGKLKKEEGFSSNSDLEKAIN
jgi:hypothetical protein